MPLLDVTDVLLDPDFVDRTLVCNRIATSVNENGIAVSSLVATPFSGVVTSGGGELVNRISIGEYGSDSITVITKFRLRSSGTGITADIVAWSGSTFTVTAVNDYATYGPGFIEATCELIPLAG